jgi:outer membrane immunogenic protein
MNIAISTSFSLALLSFGANASSTPAKGAADCPPAHKNVVHHQKCPVRHHKASCPPTKVVDCCDCAHQCCYAGWYAGGQLGIGMTRNVNKFSDFENGITTTGSNPIGTRGVLGGLHLGWGNQYRNNLYLGLEAYGNLFNNKTNRYNGGGQFTKVWRYNNFGIAPRIGHVWNCTMLYFRLGVDATTWKHQVLSNTTNTKRHTKNRIVGVAPGLGLSHMVTDHLIAGLEGSVGFYKKSHIRNYIPNPGVLEQNNFSNRTFDMALRLSYKW